MDAFERAFLSGLTKKAKSRAPVRTEKRSLLTRPLGLLAALRKRIRKK